MTRINVIPVEELADQHLLAEYRELPRVLKQDINVKGAKDQYHLGAGHMKWARRHWLFTLNRYRALYQEMLYRGYFPRYNPENMGQYLVNIAREYPEASYEVTNADIQLNRQRIAEKYFSHPDNYTWTRRNKPEWLK